MQSLWIWNFYAWYEIRDEGGVFVNIHVIILANHGWQWDGNDLLIEKIGVWIFYIDVKWGPSDFYCLFVSLVQVYLFIYLLLFYFILYSHYTLVGSSFHLPFPFSKTLFSSLVILSFIRGFLLPLVEWVVYLPSLFPI